MTVFICLNKACNFTQEFLNEDEPAACPVCDSKWYRVRYCGNREPEDVSKVNWYEKENIRWSTSMGVPAGQVNDFRKRFPDSVYSSDGRLQVKSRAHKKKLMKERGFIEHK